MINNNDRIEEFTLLLDDIEQSYGIFYTLSKIGRPVFIDDNTRTPTACVGFDKRGSVILFYFNSNFWDNLSNKERKFVIYHEMLHIILSHGIRTLDTKAPAAVNQCLDIVVNEMLLSEYGFNKKELPYLFEKQKLCLVETVFPDRKDVQYDRSFEYYYGIYKEEMAEAIKNGKLKIVSSDTLDTHDNLSEFLDDDVANEIIEKLNNELSNGEIEKIHKKLQSDSSAGKFPGNIAAGIESILGRIRVVKKRKWETVIKRFTAKYIKDDIVDHWSRDNYRVSNILTNLRFPGRLRHEYKSRARVGLLLALDTSGSCVHLAERFYKAALSIPEDTFDVHIINFDTAAYYVSNNDAKNGKTFGHGGTCIKCIEDYIQNKMVPNGSYPDACFVVTDGYFYKIPQPEKVNRWQFFLSEDNKSSIPDGAKIHMLKDFE